MHFNSEPIIKTIKGKKLVGMNQSMSYANNRTFELWRKFMPRRNEIQNILNGHLYAVEQYPTPAFYQSFDPHALFVKWAAVEVNSLNDVPYGMEVLELSEGLYAVFSIKESQAKHNHVFNISLAIGFQNLSMRWTIVPLLLIWMTDIREIIQNQRRNFGFQ